MSLYFIDTIFSVVKSNIEKLTKCLQETCRVGRQRFYDLNYADARRCCILARLNYFLSCNSLIAFSTIVAYVTVLNIMNII